MEKVSIALPVIAWNVILNALGQRPFIEVADLIGEIKRQAEAPSAPTQELSNGSE